MSVFVDTSALYALMVATEKAHPETEAAFRELLQAGRNLITSNYVLLECSAVLQRRFGLGSVRDLASRLIPILEVRWIDQGIHRRSVERLLRTDRRGLSLVVCSSFVLMEEEGIRDALALDEDFAEQGFRVLPSRRPGGARVSEGGARRGYSTRPWRNQRRRARS